MISLGMRQGLPNQARRSKSTNHHPMGIQMLNSTTRTKHTGRYLKTSDKQSTQLRRNLSTLIFTTGWDPWMTRLVSTRRYSTQRPQDMSRFIKIERGKDLRLSWGRSKLSSRTSWSKRWNIKRRGKRRRRPDQWRLRALQRSRLCSLKVKKYKSKTATNQITTTWAQQVRWEPNSKRQGVSRALTRCKQGPTFEKISLESISRIL